MSEFRRKLMFGGGTERRLLYSLDEWDCLTTDRINAYCLSGEIGYKISVEFDLELGATENDSTGNISYRVQTANAGAFAFADIYIYTQRRGDAAFHFIEHIVVDLETTKASTLIRLQTARNDRNTIFKATNLKIYEV